MKPTGLLLTNCSWCQVYSSGHLLTFSTHAYNWRVKCNYTLTQLGTEYDPQLGVFVEMDYCPSLFQGHRGCLGSLSFRDSSGVYFQISREKMGMLGIKGRYHKLSEKIDSFNGTLAWKTGRAVRILGSSKLFIEYGGGHILVGVPKNGKYDSLNGLCGSPVDASPSAGQRVTRLITTSSSHHQRYLYSSKGNFTARTGLTKSFDKFVNSWKTPLRGSGCHRVLSKDREPCRYTTSEDERSILNQCEEELRKIDPQPSENMMGIHAGEIV